MSDNFVDFGELASKRSAAAEAGRIDTSDRKLGEVGIRLRRAAVVAIVGVSAALYSATQTDRAAAGPESNPPGVTTEQDDPSDGTDR